MVAVGAERFRPKNLPLVLVAPKLDILLFSEELETADFVHVKGEQALVTQIV